MKNWVRLQTALLSEAVQKSVAHGDLPTFGGIEFSFAFQPIVDASTRRVIAFEALVRGPQGEPASTVFARLPQQHLQHFDQVLREQAVRLAARLGLQVSLNLNFLPNSAQRTSEFLLATIQVARQVGLPVDRLVFEVSESEYRQHRGSIEGAFGRCSALRFQTAIDDFGTGFSGLRRLADYQPDYVKLDRGLVTDIHLHRVQQAIVRGICCMCSELSIVPVAEGVETAEEYRWLRRAGIRIFQGYYFARPSLKALGEVAPHLF